MRATRSIGIDQSLGVSGVSLIVQVTIGNRCSQYPAAPCRPPPDGAPDTPLPGAQQRLDGPPVAALQPLRRQHELPELGLPGPERTGAGQKVVLPHPVEGLVVALPELRPGGVEVG